MLAMIKIFNVNSKTPQNYSKIKKKTEKRHNFYNLQLFAIFLFFA